MRWHCPVQLPCNDPSLDVPHGANMWQHLYNEGIGKDENAMFTTVYDWQPSERDPTACMALVELLKEAGGKSSKHQ